MITIQWYDGFMNTICIFACPSSLWCTPYICYQDTILQGTISAKHSSLDIDVWSHSFIAQSTDITVNQMQLLWYHATEIDLAVSAVKWWHKGDPNSALSNVTSQALDVHFIDIQAMIDILFPQCHHQLWLQLGICKNVSTIHMLQRLCMLRNSKELTEAK